MKEIATKDLRNIALVAHGGVGKTSLAEAILFSAGETTRMGSVDDGSTVSDYQADEIERKISVSTTLMHCFWKDVKLNIIDAPGYADFFGDAVSALPESAAVLVAFDYQPALTGELEAAAGPLMHHLFYRGARLTFVSTQPMGPALAEHFMDRMAATHAFQPADRYINLGYLAGGATGVFDFLLDPLSYAPPDSRQSAPLQGVQQLADYALIVVLTDDADTGRIWVEQMTAANLHGQIPLVMVVSAQAEPMMRPYYDSRQLDGLVSGLAGARFYEQRVSLPVETAGPYWSAFSLGLLLIVMAIAVGGSWSAVQAWRSRKPVVEQEED